MNLNPRTRRTTAALAAMILVLSLAACGSDEPEVEDPAEGAAEQASGDREDEGGAGETEGDGVVGDTEDEGGAGETEGDGVVRDTEDEGGAGETEGDGVVADSEDEGGAGETEDDRDAGEVETDVAASDVEAAKAGLARYLEANMPETPQTSTNIPGCPVIEVEVLEQALADAGHPDTTLEGWATEIEWDEYEDISTELLGVVCGGDSDGNPNDSDFGTASGMVAIDLSGHTDFDTFVGMLDVEADSDMVALCPETDFCIALWHSDGLLIGTVLMADGSDEAKVRGLLESILPDALATLAAN